MQKLSLTPSPVPETLVVRPLVLLHPHSLCLPSSPRVRCACAVAHDATPSEIMAYYASFMLDALKGLLCLILCQHKILTPTRPLRQVNIHTKLRAVHP